MSEAPAITAYRIKEAKRAIRRDCAELVYNYPQYTLEEAEEMPVGDRRLLLNFARIHRAEGLLDLTHVLASVQSKNGYQAKTKELEGSIKELTKQL